MKLKVDEIKLNPDNPRTIKDDNFQKLVRSIKEFPEMAEVREVVVNKDYMILGGNMRFQAMKEAGWKEIPVRVVDWPEDKQKEFIIKDNISGGEWNWDILANEWDVELLEEWGLETPEGFKDPEEIVEDEAPEVAEEVYSELGKIYQLGKHRVMCGDSTDAGNVTLLMNGEKADMVFTDPPYGMKLDTDYSSLNSKLEFVKDKHLKSKTGNKYDKVIGDNDDFKPELISTVFDNFGYCKEIFLWGADYYAEYLPNKNDGSWVVWDKRLEDSADKMYGSCFELCWSKAKHKRMLARIKWAGVFGTEQEFDRKRQHPTQKPIALVNWFFDYYSLKDMNRVVDLYLGSGGVLIACEQTDRICYGMELDPKYVDVIRKRYAKFCYPDTWEERWQELTPEIN